MVRLVLLTKDRVGQHDFYEQQAGEKGEGVHDARSLDQKADESRPHEHAKVAHGAHSRHGFVDGHDLLAPHHGVKDGDDVRTADADEEKAGIEQGKLWGKDDGEKASSVAEETAADERREFCIRTLGNEKFSGEQINLIVPCLQDENIPLSTLQILCRPDLPAENMNGLIRFIRGGKTNDGKQGS